MGLTREEATMTSLDFAGLAAIAAFIVMLAVFVAAS